MSSSKKKGYFSSTWLAPEIIVSEGGGFIFQYLLFVSFNLLTTDTATLTYISFLSLCLNARVINEEIPKLLGVLAGTQKGLILQQSPRLYLFLRQF